MDDPYVAVGIYCGGIVLPNDGRENRIRALFSLRQSNLPELSSRIGKLGRTSELLTIAYPNLNDIRAHEPTLLLGFAYKEYRESLDVVGAVEFWPAKYNLFSKVTFSNKFSRDGVIITMFDYSTLPIDRFTELADSIVELWKLENQVRI